ncbi:MAG: nuclear transport factor 2 family protein [Acidimicrobiia bacterium]|nr:nuclear transport factor 2 family protein [Acidimicrobiia bacterium]NNF64010.1 nuclear transport factor 2 family protein [Acidimicrobiia bacterium]
MNRDVVNTFYNALASGDGDTMASLYRPDSVFEDPAFGELNGIDAGDMWRMLCSNATDLRVRHTIKSSTDATVVTNWIAEYTFSPTGRSVTNDVTATMRFDDGKIVEHRDRFNFWKWSAQALGTPGRMLGWTPLLKGQVRKRTALNLAAFQAKNPRPS